MGYPTRFRYTKEHEWVDLEGKRAKVGITQHAQSELGDVVFVELPSIGKVVKKGDGLATVESVKAVSDVYAPVSGKVVEANAPLDAAPDTINKDPHGAGWLVVLEVADPAEVEGLLDAAAYERFLAEG
ncbi:MAG: glycine cleavage system protein GcvH [Candidatus Bipolaricaulota bacterium]|jgi:glycine cleavage system H protein|nr:glycine cleavage system protein GcvH [Candidatus Bipolaricaulota bacterium]